MSYEFWWRLENRVRLLFRRQPVRRCCCRKGENLVWTQMKTDLGFNRCTVCGSRHFELTVDPGRLGIKGSAL